MFKNDLKTGKEEQLIRTALGLCSQRGAVSKRSIFYSLQQRSWTTTKYWHADTTHTAPSNYCSICYTVQIMIQWQWFKYPQYGSVSQSLSKLKKIKTKQTKNPDLLLKEEEATLPMAFSACCNSMVKLCTGTFSDTGSTATVAKLVTIETFSTAEDPEQKSYRWTKDPSFPSNLYIVVTQWSLSEHTLCSVFCVWVHWFI